MVLHLFVNGLYTVTCLHQNYFFRSGTNLL